MGDDLIETQNYTLNGIRSLDSPIQSRKQLREGRFDISGADAPLPIYHSELDRNLINHFQKPGVRKVLRSRAFQNMLPGIDHELKMEQNPVMGYSDKFSRTMYVGKAGSNFSYAQPLPGTGKHGVRKRLFKDSLHCGPPLDKRLQMPQIEREKLRDQQSERIRQSTSPKQLGQSFSSTMNLGGSKYRVAPKRDDLSKVGNTAFGIRNHGGSHESPFYRKLPGGIAGRAPPATAPDCPDSSRSNDMQMVKDPRHQMDSNVLKMKDYLKASTKYPPHFQHHHHYGWGDAHIATTLYKPRGDVVMAHKQKTKDENHAVNYVDKVRSTHSTISKCPISMNGGTAI